MKVSDLAAKVLNQAAVADTFCNHLFLFPSIISFLHCTALYAVLWLRPFIQDNLRSCGSKLLEKNVLCLPRTVPKIRCLLPHTTLAFCVMFLYTACSKEYCITNQFNNIWQQKVYYNYKKYNFLSMHRIFKSRVYRALLSPEGV